MIDDPTQLTGHVVDALPPSLAVLLQAAPQHVVEQRMCGLQRGNRRRFVAGDGGDHGDGAGTLERFPSSEDLVKDAAECKDVGAVIARLAFELFGRHVLHGTAEPASYSRGWRTCRHHRWPHRQVEGRWTRDGHARGEPEVQQLDVRRARRTCGAEAGGKGGACRAVASGEGGAPSTNQHHVARLQVAMDDAGAMRPAERLADLDGNAKRVVERQPRRAAQSVRQRLAVEILEHQVVEIAVAANVVDRTDTGIVQRCDRARLLLETLTQLGIGSECAGQDLDGDGAIEPDITGPIHLAHATRADGVDDFVRTEAGARFERHASAF